MPIARSNLCKAKLDTALLPTLKLSNQSLPSKLSRSNNSNLRAIISITSSPARILHQRMAVNRLVATMHRYQICSPWWWSRFKTWSRMARSTSERTLSVSKWSQLCESFWLIWPTNLVRCHNHMTATPSLIRWSKTCWKWSLVKRLRSTYLGRRAMDRPRGLNHFQTTRHLSRGKVGLVLVLGTHLKLWLQHTGRS